MATKITILGQESKESKKKPIEFKHWIDIEQGSLGIYNPVVIPKLYENIELIKRSNYGCYDLMLAYDNNRSFGTLYLGHFNDGVVE